MSHQIWVLTPDFPLPAVIPGSGHGYGRCMARGSLRNSSIRFTLSECGRRIAAGIAQITISPRLIALSLQSLATTQNYPQGRVWQYYVAVLVSLSSH